MTQHTLFSPQASYTCMCIWDCGILLSMMHLNLLPSLACKKVKVMWSHYRLGVAQRVGRGIALLFHDRGTRRGWVVSSMPRPHFTPSKDPVPILQEAGWAPGPVRTGGKSRPHRDSIPNLPARSQSLYRLSYRAHNQEHKHIKNNINTQWKITIWLQTNFSTYAFILLSLLWRVHSLFRSEFSIESDLLLLLAISSVLSFL